jgi:outer membrane protein assembly factor BamB
MIRMRRAVPVVIVALLLVVPARADTNWPQFRGGSAGGVSHAKGLPDTWSATKNIAWRTEIPGKGWSSPIVWGDKIFLTSVTSDAQTPEPRKGLYIQDLTGKVQPGTHRWLVHCVDFKTGKILWQKETHKGIPDSTIHLKNTYASETPVTDGERAYAYFGNLGLFCYDLDGKELWSKKWGSYKTRMGWGTAASPVLHRDRLYILNDNEEKSFLVAVEAKTGKEVWRVEREEKSNWATPFIWENDKRTEIITCGSNRVRSYDLDGKLLWQLGGMSNLSIPTPLAQHGLLYVSSGYVMDSKRPVFAIRPSAAGDISLKEGETSNEAIAWCQKLAGAYHPSPVVYGDYLYVLLDRGFLSCYDAKTGKEIYNRQPIARGADKFTASPWAYEGKLFCLSEDGDTYVIQAGPEFKVLGKNTLDEMCLATPALARGSVILRTLPALYRIEKATK